MKNSKVKGSTNPPSSIYALVTGVAGGIGQALAKGFKDAGYYVIGTDSTSQINQVFCDHFIEADLARIVEDEVFAEYFFEQVRQLLQDGDLKVLVNNAAIQLLVSTGELTRQQWYQTLNINLLAPFFLTQAFLPELEKTQGSVINISSIHATQTKPQFVAYASSKAALSALTRNMVIDLGGRVRINAICPAAIATPMLLDGFKEHEQKLKQLAKMHPIGRIGEPREVAELALFLASDSARFVTGAEISLDGGIRARLYDPA